MLVFERLGDPGALVMEMDMVVDQSGQEVHPGPVEDMGVLGVGFRTGGPADRGDCVVLDDDIHRAAHGRSLPVDEHHVADDQPVVPLGVVHAAGLGG